MSSCPEHLRTPEDAFKKLPDFNFNSRFVDTLPGYEGLRLHFIDEGYKDAERLVLCLHGQPTWSYLYRKMIPIFQKAGQRVIAPDFFGFGKSDKPIDECIYTFNFHRNMLKSFMHYLPLKPVTLVVQDWGGTLGLTLTIDFPDQIDQLLIMNTALGVGKPLGKGFEDWRKWVEENPNFQVSRLMKRSCPHLLPEELQAYDAPFPSSEYRAGLRRFPAIMPDTPEKEGADISQKTINFLNTDWKGKSLIAIGMLDPVFGPVAMNSLAEKIRCNPKILEISSGGHFLQEWGKDIAEFALDKVYN